jgi:phage terminase small subunit
MRKRGRKSAAEFATPVVDVRRHRLEPPGHLGKVEAQRFADLAAACDPEHFRESDLPLLVRYVEADLLAEQAARELRKDGPVVDGRASPWLIVQEKSVRAMVALAMRLRLSPQSRIDPKAVGRKQPVQHWPWLDELRDDGER